MDKPCEINDLTVDASVCGKIKEYEINGKLELRPVEFGQPFDMSVFCSNCGAELDLNEVADHLKGAN